MVACSWATVCYLQRHMKNMEENRSSFSSPHLRSQIRVTVTGIIQGVNYFICSAWISINTGIHFYYDPSYDDNYHISSFAICLYSLATTINLGVGHMDEWIFALLNVPILMMYFAETSLTSSVWLNVFYFTQIVPCQKSFFIWMKKNIKPIIYFMLVTDRSIYLGENVASSYLFFRAHSNFSTNTENNTLTNSTWVKINIYSFSCYTTKIVTLFLSLVVMVACSWATVCYLQRHMKNMEENRSSFSSPHLRSQIRVTVTGIVQGVNYFICSAWISINNGIHFYYDPSYDDKFYISSFAISLYSLATTINLGVGQSLFRKRAADLWQGCGKEFSPFGNILNRMSRVK
uniref:Taste receptor type 2 n=1 Tax=Denticeps clupeoides TaxID=299321 RepID=A0AAY4E3E0_9TELE